MEGILWELLKLDGRTCEGRDFLYLGGAVFGIFIFQVFGVVEEGYKFKFSSERSDCTDESGRESKERKTYFSMPLGKIYRRFNIPRYVEAAVLVSLGGGLFG